MKVTLDINFGDPITPAPRRVELPSQRPQLAPVSLWGYPIETVVAEKACTAVVLGEANTRVRDYADLYTLIGKHRYSYAEVRAAVEATAAYRRQDLVPLSRVLGALATMRQDAYRAFREGLRGDGEHLPSDLGTVASAVAAFLDPVLEGRPNGAVWDPESWAWRQWSDRRADSTHGGEAQRGDSAVPQG